MTKQEWLIALLNGARGGYGIGFNQTYSYNNGQFEVYHSIWNISNLFNPNDISKNEHFVILD